MGVFNYLKKLVTFFAFLYLIGEGSDDMTDFERIFIDNKDFIFKYLMKLTNNHSLSEELAEETFFRAYINFSSLRDKEKAPVWLCQIAKNTYYGWCRQEKNIGAFEEGLESIESSYNIEEEYVQKELSQRAMAALEQLDNPWKDVIKLSVFGGLSLSEISKAYGKSESWARVTFYRAKQKLLEKMR